MQFKYFILLLTIGFVMGKISGGDLQVQIKSKILSFKKTDDVQITLQYKNTGNKEISIYKWLLGSGDLWDPILSVVCNKKQVAYIGPFVKRRAPEKDDTISLSPGETRSAIARLSSSYDMTQTGSCSIKFKMERSRVVFNENTNSKTSFGNTDDDFESNIESNDIQLHIEPRPNVERERPNSPRRHPRAVSITYTSCTQTRRSVLNTAVNSATTYADNAVTYLNTTAPSGTIRYATWFGTFTSTNWDLIKQTFTSIQSAFVTKPLTFDCSCKTSGVYAYVYPNSPYKIYLCGAFWSAPNTGTDSRAGTLVHEMSHFTVVGATQDYAYGQSACKSLALSNPSKAVKNADSHEYFVENNPVLS